MSDEELRKRAGTFAQVNSLILDSMVPRDHTIVVSGDRCNLMDIEETCRLCGCQTWIDLRDLLVIAAMPTFIVCPTCWHAAEPEYLDGNLG